MNPYNPSAPPLEPNDVDKLLTFETSSKLAKCDTNSTVVELTVSASSLLNRDPTSKSDPVCILYTKQTGGDWIELEKTECVKNDLNPQWCKKFSLPFKFEERQMLRFRIYDWDGNSQSLSSHDYLGELECALGEIVSSPHGKLTRSLKLPNLHGEKPPSTLTVVAEELGECHKVLSLKLNCQILIRKNSIFGNSFSLPCLVISKQLDDLSWVLVCRTDRLDRLLHLRISSITSGNNLERPLKWELFHKKQNSKWANAKLIGEFRTNYLEILERYEKRKGAFTLCNKESKDASVPTATIGILQLQVEEHPTFLDHIRNGLKLHVTFAIDFTSSNGEPTRHTSLHYKHGGKDNPYVMAIKAVGEIMLDYSNDKRFAAFGFGAKGYPEGNRVSHKFPINFRMNDPCCEGVEGVITAYYRVMKRIKLFGPTYFTPVIQEQIRMAKEVQATTGQSYHVLLILTDGIVCDPVSTRDIIVSAADHPISIIIIGIGDEDFKEMETLDCDGGFLKNSQGKSATRDICQFVDLKKFINFKSILPISAESKAALTQAVLAELPTQVCDWMNIFTK